MEDLKEAGRSAVFLLPYLLFVCVVIASVSSGGLAEGSASAAYLILVLLVLKNLVLLWRRDPDAALQFPERDADVEATSGKFARNRPSSTVIRS